MSLLKTVAVDEAQGIVKEIYDEAIQIMRRVPNALQLWSVSEEAIAMQWSMIKSSMDKDKEDQVLATALRYLVAESKDCTYCTYCTGMNASFLMNMYGMSADELEAMRQDPSTAPFPSKQKALLLFTLKAMNHKDDVNKNDIKELEDLGITQKEMFESVRGASNMLIVTNLFGAFKVEIDF